MRIIFREWLEQVYDRMSCKPMKFEDITTVEQVPSQFLNDILKLPMLEWRHHDLPKINPPDLNFTRFYLIKRQFRTGYVFYLVNTEGYRYPRYMTLLEI